MILRSQAHERDRRSMVKLNPIFLKENGKARFVVLTMREYRGLREALEDAKDALILEEAKRRNAGKPRIPHEQIMREFGLTPRRKKTKHSSGFGTKR